MHATEAIVLKRRNSGEADELVTFYTRDYGKLSIKARSSKKITTKQGTFLHNPAIVHFNFVLARKGYILSGIKSIREYPAISENITASAYADSFLSLCDSVTYEGQKDDEIWNLLCRVLQDAQKGAESGASSEEFWRMEKEWLIAFLNTLGFASQNLNLKRVKNARQLDTHLKRLLQNKLERPVDFFGLKATFSK